MTTARSACESNTASSTTSASTTTPSGPVGPGTALDDLVGGVGLLITMMPGSGPGLEAEQLLREMGSAVVPGTPNHVATVATPGGRVNLVTYQEPLIGGPAGGELVVCVAEIGRDGTSATCTREHNQDPDLGMHLIRKSDRNSITVYGGAAPAFAILETEKHARIGIITIGGWAYANWPQALGGPASITFYDNDANQGFRSTYDLG